MTGMTNEDYEDYGDDEARLTRDTTMQMSYCMLGISRSHCNRADGAAMTRSESALLIHLIQMQQTSLMIPHSLTLSTN